MGARMIAVTDSHQQHHWHQQHDPEQLDHRGSVPCFWAQHHAGGNHLRHVMDATAQKDSGLLGRKPNELEGEGVNNHADG